MEYRWINEYNVPINCDDTRIKEPMSPIVCRSIINARVRMRIPQINPRSIVLLNRE